MEPRNKTGEVSKGPEGHHQNALPQEISSEQRALNEAAHSAADRDIDADAEFSAHSKNDDLDEGETARLGEDVGGII